VASGEVVAFRVVAARALASQAAGEKAVDRLAPEERTEVGERERVGGEGREAVAWRPGAVPEAVLGWAVCPAEATATASQVAGEGSATAVASVATAVD